MFNFKDLKIENIKLFKDPNMNSVCVGVVLGGIFTALVHFFALIILLGINGCGRDEGNKVSSSDEQTSEEVTYIERLWSEEEFSFEVNRCIDDSVKFWDTRNQADHFCHCVYGYFAIEVEYEDFEPIEEREFWAQKAIDNGMVAYCKDIAGQQ